MPFKTVALPRMRYVVLAVIGIFGVPWAPATPKTAMSAVPAQSANTLYSEASRRFNSKRTHGSFGNHVYRLKRLSQYTPSDWQLRQKWLLPTGQPFPKGLEDPSALKSIEEARWDREQFRGELATLQKGLTLPFYVANYEVLSGQYIGVRELARLSARDGNLKQLDGDYSGALTAYLDAYALGMQMYQGRTLLSGMIGVLCEGIAMAPAERTVTHLTAAQARAAATRLESLMARRMALEQVLANELATTQEQLRYYADPRAQEQFWGRIPLVRITNEALIQRYQQVMEQYRTEAAQPFQRFRTGNEFYPNPYDPLMILAAQNVPNVIRASTTYTWRTVVARRLMLKLALHAWQKEHHGLFTPRLSELVTEGYLKALPADAFSTSGHDDFRYDPVTGKLWSVGWDGTDQHGVGDDPAGTLFGA